MGFLKTATYTIDHTKIGSANISDARIWIVFTDPDYATIANGGFMQSDNYFDFCIHSDALLTTKLKWIMKYYDPVTGTIAVVCNVPTLSHTVDTVVYFGFDDASISSFQGGALSDVYGSDYPQAMLYPDGSVLSLTDSSGNGNDGTDGSGVSGHSPLLPTTGVIPGGAMNDPSNEAIEDTCFYFADDVAAALATGPAVFRTIFTPNADINAFPTLNYLAQRLNTLSESPSDNDLLTGFSLNTVGYNGTLFASYYNGSGYVTNVGTQNAWLTGVTYDIVIIIDPATGVFIYVNGAVDGSFPGSFTRGSGSPSTQYLYGADWSENFRQGLNGVVSYSYVRTTVPTADEVAMEYSNVFDGDFAALGSTQDFGGGLSQTINSSVTLHGIVVKSNSKVISKSITLHGAILKSTNKLINKSITFHGSLLRALSKIISSSLTFLGAVSTHSVTPGVKTIDSSFTLSSALTGHKRVVNTKTLDSDIFFSSIISHAIAFLGSAARKLKFWFMRRLR